MTRSNNTKVIKNNILISNNIYIIHLMTKKKLYEFKILFIRKTVLLFLLGNIIITYLFIYFFFFGLKITL